MCTCQAANMYLSGHRCAWSCLAPDPGVSVCAVVLLDVRVVLVFGEVRGEVQDALRDPSAMAWRAVLVGQPVPETDRSGDGLQVEAPRAQERAPVVPPALIAPRPAVLPGRREVACCLLAVSGVCASPVPPPPQPASWDRQATASYGPRGASTLTAATASGRRAAVARAYEAPPENPHTAIRLIPRSFMMAATSTLQSAITRPGIGVEPPYAGRS
jgi:hypothetical protein